MSRVVLNIAPHPDDEVLGAGGALRLLGINGWRVHTLACSLGRPADHERRRRELIEAARRIEFYTTIMTPLAQISSGDDLDTAAVSIADAVERMVATTGAEIVVSPHPHDGHHGHEAVARGVENALSRTGDAAPRWWMWGLWSDLPAPTIYAPFGHTVMGEVREAIDAYSGENARNQYDRLYPARASAYTVLGIERVFGYGTARSTDAPYADLLTEVSRRNGRWYLGHPRLFDATDPVPQSDAVGEDITWWITGRSVAAARAMTR